MDDSIYIFPMASGIGVYNLTVVADGRVVAGRVKVGVGGEPPRFRAYVVCLRVRVQEKQEARRRYQEAVQQGRTAALLERNEVTTVVIAAAVLLSRCVTRLTLQASEDIFSIRVGALPPNSTVEVHIAYVSEVRCS